jgi:hypothetical protein
MSTTSLSAPWVGRDGLHLPIGAALGPPSRPRAAGSPTPAADAPRWDPAQGPHESFEQSPGFDAYAAHFRDQLDFLVAFCRDQQMPRSELAPIVSSLDKLFERRFLDPDFFRYSKHIVDSVGMQSLDAFCGLVGTEAIRPGIRRLAIVELACGVVRCTEEAVAAVASAACGLSKAAGGLCALRWEIKEETACAALRQTAQAAFGQLEDFRDLEPYYVGSAWNELASEYGMTQATNAIWVRQACKPQFLDEGRIRINAALARIPAYWLPDFGRPMRATDLDPVGAEQLRQALADAMSTDDGRVVQALHMALRTLLRHGAPDSGAPMALAHAMAAPDAAGRPALLHAIKSGHLHALRAYFDLLKDPDVAPRIATAIPHMIGAAGPTQSGLALALCHGHADIIHAYRDLLNELLRHPETAACLRAALPDLLLARLDNGTAAAEVAHAKGHDAALNAYRALRADAAMTG